MNADDQAIIVSGMIVISEERESFRGGNVNVTLEEISRSDVGSRSVAEIVLSNIEHRKGTTGIPFSLEVKRSEIDERMDYSVRVWIDTDASGSPGESDLFSERSYRVLTKGYGSRIEIAF